MNKLNLFLTITFISVFFFACQKDDLVNSTHDELNDEISKELAQNVALNFCINKNFYRSSTDKKLKSNSSDYNFKEKEIKEVIVVPDETNSPTLYVIKFNPSGYVVVSATKKESPILGYSESAIFDINNLPYGITTWFIDRIDKIQLIKSSENFEISTAIEEQWALMSGGPVTEDQDLIEWTEVDQNGPLLNTLWGQWNGYNNLLERINGELPPTGCVATAIAQIMRYHEYPTNYNWTAMPNTYGTNETAKLMRDIGEAVNMNYSLSGSAANMDNAVNAFINTFNYSSTVKYVSIEDVSIVSELRNNRPVIIDGSHTYYTTTSGIWPFKTTTHHYEDGHAWVCDGFKKTTYYETLRSAETGEETTTSTSMGYYYHMNWGWSGSGMGSSDNNGWFKFDDLEINGVTRSNGEHPNYQHRKKCIVGIKH